MSLGDRLGIAGLVVALLGIGITILWPEKKWVGWLCLGVAGLLILLWVLAEFRVLLDIIRRYPKPIGATALIIGMSIFGIFAWRKWISNPSVPQIAKQNKPKGEEPKTEPLNMQESSKPRPLSLSRIEVTNFAGVPVRNKLTNKPGYFFNVYYENKGSVAATLLTRKGKAEHPDHLLSTDELNVILRQINEASDGPLDTYQEIQPGPPGQFFSFPLESDAEEMVGPAQDALSGKTRLYLFFQMKYRDADKPSARVKVTYFCGWFLDTFTMWHNCGTKIYSKP